MLCSRGRELGLLLVGTLVDVDVDKGGREGERRDVLGTYGPTIVYV
jgi:hypothetical protein